MSNEGMQIVVAVNRRSIFPRVLRPQKILLDGMKLGISREGRFREGEYGDNFAVAYHPDHIGRGIRIRWDNSDVRFTELCLNLPVSEEELDDFFLMCARLARQDLSEVKLNGKPFGPKQYHKIRDSYRVYNLKLLHEMMGNVLNKEPERLFIGCVFHRVAAGEKEAERMWAGVDTSAYRDWLHESQSGGRFFSEARVDEGTADGRHAVFTIPSERSVILPDHEELPVRFYDLKTGRPSIEISKWIVELVDQIDHTETKVLGAMPLKEFRRLLPSEKVTYFDAADSLISPLSRQELSMMLEQAEQDNA